MTARNLITVIYRTVLRRLIGAGIDLASTRGKPAAGMTREERQQAKATAKRARKMLRITRRFLR